MKELKDYVFLPDIDGNHIYLVERTGKIWKQPMFCLPCYRTRGKVPALLDWRDDCPGPVTWQWKDGYQPVLEIRGENTLLELLTAGEYLLVRKNGQTVRSYPDHADPAGLFAGTLLAQTRKWSDFIGSCRPPAIPEGHHPDAWKSCLVQAFGAWRFRHPRYGVGTYGYSIHDSFMPAILTMANVLLEYGHAELAFDRMDYFLERFILEDGSNDYYGPSLAEYGMLLELCERFGAQPGGPDWLNSHRKVLARIVRYLIRMRNPLINGSGDLFLRLLPGVPEADTRDIGGIYTHNNAWVWRGMLAWKNIAGLLKLPEAFCEAQAEAEDLAEQLRSAINSHLTPDGLVPYLISPDFRLGDFQETRNSVYANYRYYPELLDSGFLTREESLKLIEARETRHGELEGMTLFHYQAVCPDDRELAPYGCDNWPIFPYGRALARLGERERLIRLIDGHYKYHQTRDTFTAYESVEADTPERRAITDWCVPAQLIYPGLLRELEKTAP